MTGVRRSATLLLVGTGLLGVGLPGATAAFAEERVVRIGRDGVQPQVLQAQPGDTLRFVNDDPTFAYRAQSTGGPWRFDSGPTALLSGDYVVPSALPAAGTYAYRVAQDGPFAGRVVVDGGAPATSAAAATPAPSAVTPVPSSGPSAPSSGPSASATATAVPAPVAAPAVPGPLAGRRDERALGLAVTVAAVLLAGVASLLLRLLLAVPVLSDRPARL